MALIDDASRGC